MGEVFMGGSGGGGAKVTTGSVGVSWRDGTTVSIGFTPDLVILYNANNNDGIVASGGTGNDTGSYIPRIFTKAYSGGSGAIVTDGFRVSVSNSATLYYIAVKF